MAPSAPPALPASPAHRMPLPIPLPRAPGQAPAGLETPFGAPCMDLSLIDLIEADERPTFVVTARPKPGIEYANAAADLPDAGALAERIYAIPDTPQDAPFWDWLLGWILASDGGAVAPSSMAWFGYTWSRMVVGHGTCVVASANLRPVPSPCAGPSPLPSPSAAASPSPSTAAEVPLPATAAEVPPPPPPPPPPAAYLSGPSVDPPPIDADAPRSDDSSYPVGMCFGGLDGSVSFANDAWRRITGCAPVPAAIEPGAFRACVVDEDQAKLAQAYADLASDGTATAELRIRVNEEPAPAGRLAGPPPVRHVSACYKAEKLADGSVTILTCLMDVTAHKQAADEAHQRTRQAQILQRMAEVATVGLFVMDEFGTLVGANHVFFTLCGLEPVDPSSSLAPFVIPWLDCVAPEDRPILLQMLARLVADESGPQTAELRPARNSIWKCEDAAGQPVEAPRWVLLTVTPFQTHHGAARLFTGSLTDVSLQRHQLALETQRKEEAISSRLQQESLIDITSHELRNPLGAIVNCTDAVTGAFVGIKSGLESLLREKKKRPTRVAVREARIIRKLLDPTVEGIENAETIIECAQHQKIIVDDILTLSKLDSQLLAVAPCTASPVGVTRDVLKMFDAESRRVDIDLALILDKSCQASYMEFLDFDPSRVRQVLINLLTNAIKFTKTCQTRVVTVKLHASFVRPTEEEAAVRFLPRASAGEGEYGSYAQPDLEGRGEPTFLMWQVQDTGQGLSQAETQKLFNRFVQASSRTHVKYGGSGLGLFIAKQLAELQQGAIGVASEQDVGSIFSFYIEAYTPTTESLLEARAVATAKAEARALTTRVLSSDEDEDYDDEAAAVHSEDDDRHRAPANHQPEDSDSDHGGPAPAKSATSPIPTGQSRIGARSGRCKEAKESMGRLRPAIANRLGIGRILLVEDNKINQRALERSLNKFGFHVVTAEHGLEAIEQLGAATEDERIDLVLMDVEMPVQDGLTCTTIIRGLEKTRDIPGPSDGSQHRLIIALTGNARDEQIAAAKAAGCNEVLTKPFRLPELFSKLEEIEKAKAWVGDLAMRPMGGGLNNVEGAG